MKIEKGDRFICIKSTNSDNEYNSPYYTKGIHYECEIENCLTDNSGFKKHQWQPIDKEFFKHFKLI